MKYKINRLVCCSKDIHESRKITFSVMQSDGNSFWADIVLDSFIMAYRDEGSIFDQKF